MEFNVETAATTTFTMSVLTMLENVDNGLEVGVYHVDEVKANLRNSHSER